MKPWMHKAQLTTLKRLALLTAFSCASMAANADQNTGKITVFHLNGDVPDRGVCIQMNPAGSIPYLCLYKSNSLYKELTALLLAGHLSAKTCTVSWTTAGINWAECY